MTDTIFCISCGSKTAVETDYDIDCGTQYTCGTCGARFNATKSEPVQHTVEPYKHVPYSPVYSHQEMLMYRISERLFLNAFGQSKIMPMLNGKKQGEAERNDKIVFRRNVPFNESV